FLTWPNVETYYRSLCHRAVYRAWNRRLTSASHHPYSIPWSKTVECRRLSGSTAAQSGIASVLTSPSMPFLMVGMAVIHGTRLRLRLLEVGGETQTEI